MSPVVTESFRVAPAFPSFVEISIVDSGRDVPPCERCGDEPGLVGVHWRPGYDSTRTGLSQVGPRCTEGAVEDAVEDSVQNTIVRVELDLHARSLPLPLRNAA